MSNLIFCVLEIPKIFICVVVRKVTFLFEDCCPSETVSPITFSALEMREKKKYRKQTGLNLSALLSKVSALDHDRFMQVSL